MKNRIRLGFNIDHVATLRNARGEGFPSPLKAAMIGKRNKVDLITAHLREDRRHIREKDLYDLKKKIKIPLNLEIALTKEMISFSLKLKPNFICIVPENRKEITTEGGLNTNLKKKFLQDSIIKLKKKHIKVSLFIDPDLERIKDAKMLGADSVELHTGNFCKQWSMKDKKRINREFYRLKKSTDYAKSLGLNVHAGHGLNYQTAKVLSKIKGIEEFNIGHFFIADSIFIGIENVLKKFNRLLKR